MYLSRPLDPLPQLLRVKTSYDDSLERIQRRVRHNNPDAHADIPSFDFSTQNGVVKYGKLMRALVEDGRLDLVINVTGFMESMPVPV
ncbi:hypothetical protein QCA50_007142 [Cerrena zonata]|uniref:Uncharacterized protein n=1 Tax=Cerrena zonata TaxID=2478898 RepID=A0AAW0G994_9APHY